MGNNSILMADDGGAGRFATLHELRERCRQLDQTIWEECFGLYDFGYVEKLAPEDCHFCAITCAITRSMIREIDGARPSPQTRIFLQHIGTVSHPYSRKPSVLFERIGQESGWSRWEFGFLRLHQHHGKCHPSTC
jgi:hypothetical protein